MSLNGRVDWTRQDSRTWVSSELDEHGNPGVLHEISDSEDDHPPAQNGGTKRKRSDGEAEQLLEGKHRYKVRVSLIHRYITGMHRALAEAAAVRAAAANGGLASCFHPCVPATNTPAPAAEAQQDHLLEDITWRYPSLREPVPPKGIRIRHEGMRIRHDVLFQ